jgi:hypothetical protein
MLAVFALLVLLVGGVVTVGVAQGWRVDSWSLALAVLAWVMLGATALRVHGSPGTLALSAECMLGSVALGLAAWRQLRRRGFVALWLTSGWIGVVIALAR